MIRILAFIALIWASSAAYLFLDTYNKVSPDDVDCFRGKGYLELIVRALMSSGKVDPNAPESITNIFAGGMGGSVYLTPCVQCDDPERQANDVCELMQNSLTNRYVFIDVDHIPLWNKDNAKNIDFLTRFESAIGSCSAGYVPAIITKKGSWEQIMGKDYSGQSDKWLWYIGLNNEPEPTDFKPFGGWTRARSKTFTQGVEECGLKDMNADAFVVGLTTALPVSK